MVCVWPPHTSMNLKWSSAASSVMRATSARAIVGSRYSSTKRIRLFLPSPWLRRDARGHERRHLLGVRLTHEMQRGEGQAGLFLVDLGHGKAHVDENPVADFERFVFQESDVDDARHTGNVDAGQVVIRLHQLDYLARYSQAHAAASFNSGSGSTPTSARRRRAARYRPTRRPGSRSGGRRPPTRHRRNRTGSEP